MLSAGYGGRLMTDWFGVTALRRLRIRFASRVWPGDVLTATGKVTAKNEADGLLECEFTLANQDGEVVVRGDATVSPGR
jgi:acyl dehydratase